MKRAFQICKQLGAQAIFSQHFLRYLPHGLANKKGNDLIGGKAFS